MQSEGNNMPPEKSERDSLLEELSGINDFLKKWGPLYVKLLDKSKDIYQENKYLVTEIHKEHTSDDRNQEHIDQLLEQFSDAIGEGRNLESVKSEYIQKLNRRVEIEERLKEMRESN